MDKILFTLSLFLVMASSSPMAMDAPWNSLQCAQNCTKKSCKNPMMLETCLGQCHNYPKKIKGCLKNLPAPKAPQPSPSSGIPDAKNVRPLPATPKIRPLSVPRAHQKEKSPFYDLMVLYYDKYRKEEDPKEKKKIQQHIIIGLNNMMRQRVLKPEHKKEALKFAKEFGIASFNARLTAYYAKEKDYGAVPEEILKLIITHLSEGGSVQDLINLLRVSKSFNLLLLKSPVSIDLSPFGKKWIGIDDDLQFIKSKINDEHLAQIVALFPNMRSLNLKGADVKDLSLLSALTNLTHLDLGETHVSDISPLSTLTNLTYLNLAETSISDISPLSTLAALTYLNLYGASNVLDISPLSTLTHLRYLDLGMLIISDFSILSALTDLTYLKLYYTSVSDISPLKGLEKLESVDVVATNVSWESIENLQALRPKLRIVHDYVGGHRGS